MSGAINSRTWCVYWLRDRKGRLLWVGSTGNLKARLNQHRGKSRWWPSVDESQIVHRVYPSLEEMRAAEAKELAERPGQWNKRGVPGRGPSPASSPWQPALVRQKVHPDPWWDRISRKVKEKE